jgi:hypothetical protein
MTRDEYTQLFHREQLNLVAFKRLMDCDHEVLRLVNAAIKAEREACAKVCDEVNREYDGEEVSASWVAAAIRARSQA